MVRQRWKEQLQLVQQVVKSCAPLTAVAAVFMIVHSNTTPARRHRDPEAVDETGMDTIAQHVRAQDKLQAQSQLGQGLRRDMQVSPAGPAPKLRRC